MAILVFMTVAILNPTPTLRPRSVAENAAVRAAEARV
jgi:hypothetical protein